MIDWGRTNGMLVRFQELFCQQSETCFGSSGRVKGLYIRDLIVMPTLTIVGSKSLCTSHLLVAL